MYAPRIKFMLKHSYLFSRSLQLHQDLRRSLEQFLKREKLCSSGLLHLSPSIMESSPITLYPAPPPSPPSPSPPPPKNNHLQLLVFLLESATPVLWLPVTLRALDPLPTSPSQPKNTVSSQSFPHNHKRAPFFTQIPFFNFVWVDSLALALKKW